MPVKQIVTQRQARRLAREKVLSDQKRLREPFRFGLFGITEPEPPLRAVAEQLLEVRQIMRCGNDQDVAKSAAC